MNVCVGTHAGARGKPVDDSSAKHIDGTLVDCALRAYFFYIAQPNTLMASRLVTAPRNTLTTSVLIARYARPFFFKRSAKRLEGKPVDDAPPGTLMASLLVTAPPNTLKARLLIVRYARIFFISLSQAH